jgi:hypothetical protein
MKRRCIGCGHWFYPKHYNSQYCTDNCQRLARNLKWRNKQPARSKRRCKVCGHWFLPVRKDHVYCNYKCSNYACIVQHNDVFKQRAVDYKGGKCKLCGYDKYLAALEFHHRNPKCKDHTIHLRNSWNKTKHELDKCDLLCANCHRETHVKLRNNKRRKRLTRNSACRKLT